MQRNRDKEIDKENDKKKIQISSNSSKTTGKITLVHFM